MKTTQDLTGRCTLPSLALTHLLLVLALLPWGATAAVKTWDGSSSGYWGTGANWSGGTVPVDGDELVFPAGPTRLAATNNLSTTRRFGSITISGASYALRGNSLTLSNGITATYGAGSQTSVELDIILAQGQTFECTTVNSILDIKGDILLGEHSLLANAAGNMLLGGRISGTGGISKYGDGDLRLYGSAANSYTGTTRVNVGTLELFKTSGLNAMAGNLVIGNNTGGGEKVLWLSSAQLPSSTDVTVNTGAVLDLNNHNEALGSVTLNGGVVQTGSGLLSLSENIFIKSNVVTAAFSGSVSLVGATRSITVEANGEAVDPELDFPADLQDGGGSVTLKWIGLPVAGLGGGFFKPSVILSGSSTHAGITLFTNINVLLEHPMALGGTNEGTVLAGSTLTLYASVTNETLSTLPGDFANNLFPSGVVRWAGPVVLGTTTRFRSSTAEYSLEIRGQISGDGPLEIGGYGGTGTVILSGTQANTHSGSTHLHSGSLLLRKNSGNAIVGSELVIGDSGGTDEALVREEGNFQIANLPVTVNETGLLDLDTHDDTLQNLVLNGGYVNVETGVLTLSGSLTVLNNAVRQARFLATGGGGIELNAAIPFIVANSSFAIDLRVEAPISGTGGFIKSGIGAVGLYSGSSFTGVATINEGVIFVFDDTALGSTAAGTVVSAGAALVVGADRHVGAEPLVLNGNGDGGFGALGSIGGSNSWSGSITLATDSFITVQTNRFLNLTGVLTGPAGFSKGQAGTIILSGPAANTFAGNTAVNEGTILLDKAVTDGALPGPGTLTIGLSTGERQSAVVRELRNFQIDSSVNMTVNFSGWFDLNGHSDTVGGITLNTGIVHADDTLTLDGDVQASSISGWVAGISLGHVVLKETRTFTVSEGSDFALNTHVMGTAELVKRGPGDMSMSWSNSYSGLTRVAEGTLTVQTDFGLGSTAGGTLVEEGAELRLGGVIVEGESLTLSGTNRALHGWNTNLWTGPVTLTTNPSIYTYRLEDEINIQGVINGRGGLKVEGYGTVILSGSQPNTYEGPTRVTKGTLLLSKIPMDGAVPGDLIIGDGSGGSGADVVRLGRANQIANTAHISVSGSGLFDLNGYYDRVDAVTGTGRIILPGGHLIAGHSGSSFVFSGLVSGTGYLWKVGAGVWTLTGDNTYTGTTQIEGGTLMVNGSQPASDVNVLNLGTLAGAGTVGRLTSTGGLVSPGSSPGTLTSSNLLFDAETDLRIELADSAGDRLNVNGKVGLANASLILSAPGLLPAEGQQFVIVSNDDTDAVTGTFAGLPEGAMVSAGPRQFRITYEGDTGNDVVLIATNTAALHPILAITATDTNTALVSWPQSDISWLLQTSTNLLSTEGWVPLPPPYTSNASDVLVIQPAAQTNQFYRLLHL